MLTLDSDMERRVIELAGAIGKPPAQILREALQAYYDHLEDEADLKDAREALEEDGSIPWEDVKREAGL
jgi:predicted DNA-binding protein